MNEKSHPDPPPTPIRLLSESECARLIGMSQQFLRKSRMNGTLEKHTPGPPFIRIGRSIRYSIDDLNAWIAEHRHPIKGGSTNE